MKAELQIVTCKCGSIVAGHAYPHCLSDEDWIRRTKYWENQGKQISFAENPVQFDLCKCNMNTTDCVIDH